MALDALLCRKIDCTGAGTFTPIGPLNYMDPAASFVSYIDLGGRIGIDETLAVVALCTGPVTGNVDVKLQSDDNTAFSTPKDERVWTAPIKTTSGRKADGKGPHLLGYITGPGQRYLRWQLVAAAAAGVIEMALTRDWPLRDLVP